MKANPLITLFRMSLIVSFLLSSCHYKGIELSTTIGSKEEREAAAFLLEQVTDYYGVSHRYKNETQDNLNSLINNYLGTNDLVDSLSAYAVTDTLWDATHLRLNYLLKNIRQSFSHYRNNPLKMKVPDSIFNEYILPYRVGYEVLEDWRLYFNTIYNAYLSTINEKEIDERAILAMVNDYMNITYHVYDRTGLAKYPISLQQSLKDIREVAHPYDCVDYAFFKLYSYRSIGLPAAFETIPYYGKFNFGHSETSLWHRDGKFHCTEGKTEMPYKFQIAKMYRKRFSRTKNPYQLILNEGEATNNIPVYFDMPYYEDITDERTLVSDVLIHSKSALEQQLIRYSKIAYLCVYNNGGWKPVEWARLNKDRNWLFKKMGRKILYQAAVMIDGQQHLIGFPFLLDSIGRTRYFMNEFSENCSNIVIEKYDRNRSFEKGVFDLYFWNGISKNWKQIQQIRVSGEKVVLHLATNRLYKIQAQNSDNNPRPFSIENNEQIWW